jgi:hypothetical protein
VKISYVGVGVGRGQVESATMIGREISACLKSAAKQSKLRYHFYAVHHAKYNDKSKKYLDDISRQALDRYATIEKWSSQTRCLID